MNRYDNLSLIRNIHKDKPIFIFGSGPSLDDYSDLNDITKHGISIACNASVMKLKRCDYFLFTDGTVPYLSYFDHAVSTSDKVLICNHLEMDHIHSSIEKSYQFNRRGDDPENRIFNVDDVELIIGSDCIHVAAHCAYIMGGNPIILVGVDLKIRDGKKYFSDFLYDNKENDPSLENSFNEWRCIKDQNPNIVFFNASMGGRLGELYPSVDLEKFNCSTQV